MPIYRYACRCGHFQDEFRSMAERNDALMHCGVAMQRVLTPPRIMSELEPYRAIAADKETGKCPIIEGRKQHREFLRRNNYEEAGNDPFVPTSDDKRPAGIF